MTICTSPLGKHILLELYGCNTSIINDVGQLKTYMNEAAEKSGATILESRFHLFSPYGVSGVVIIAESHLTIHTWPEHDYAAVDFFTCGDIDPLIAVDYLKEKLESQSHQTKEFSRGILNPSNNVLQKAPPQLKQCYGTP